MNYCVILKENKENGHVGLFAVTEKQLNEIRSFQNAGGFKRFDIDIMNENVSKPSLKDKKARKNFFENMKL